MNTQALNDGKLAELAKRRSDLEREIADKESELALLQCAAVAEEPRLPELLPEPETAGIDEDDWNARDVSLLEGCWDLESNFSTTNRQTGVRSRYNVWRMCFDANGVGREDMRSESGSTCSGPVSGRFDANGSLVIEQPANLQCSDGGFIYRMRGQCALNQEGTANCALLQPEVGGTADVEFRRAERGE